MDNTSLGSFGVVIDSRRKEEKTITPKNYILTGENQASSLLKETKTERKETAKLFPVGWHVCVTESET